MALDLLLPIGFRARTARASLIVDGVNVIGNLSSTRVISFTYEDNTTDKADSVKFEIEDKGRSWMLKHMPRGGEECNVSLITSDWRAPADNRTLNCGTFWIDEINCSGPPNAINIKGNSTPVTTGIKDTKKNRAWESASIQTVGKKIAADNELTFVYDVQQEPAVVKRTDQVDKSDLEYFRNKCKDAGLEVKIHNKQLIVYSQKEYEAREPSFTFIYGDSNILDWTLVKRHNDVYKECKESYVNPETGKLTKVVAKTKGGKPETKAKLNVNEGLNYGPNGLIGGTTPRGRNFEPDPDSDYVHWQNDDPAKNKGKGKGGKKAAKAKAEKKLKDKNKKHKTFGLTLIGDTMYLSGLTCLLQGFGVFDDKYFMESVCHDISSSGYTCKIKMRWCQPDVEFDDDPDPDWLYTTT